MLVRRRGNVTHFFQKMFSGKSAGCGASMEGGRMVRASWTQGGHGSTAAHDAEPSVSSRGGRKRCGRLPGEVVRRKPCGLPCAGKDSGSLRGDRPEQKGRCKRGATRTLPLPFPLTGGATSPLPVFLCGDWSAQELMRGTAQIQRKCSRILGGAASSGPCPEGFTGT